MLEPGYSSMTEMLGQIPFEPSKNYLILLVNLDMLLVRCH